VKAKRYIGGRAWWEYNCAECGEYLHKKGGGFFGSYDHMVHPKNTCIHAGKKFEFPEPLEVDLVELL
jgi:hypothetical protein